jgi:hypothetical protein
VDLGTGLFVLTAADLQLPDVLPISLQRTYRQNDTVSRSFGIGATHPYDMFLVGAAFPSAYTYQELILPDGARVHYDRISTGTSYADAVYEHTSSGTAFYKSRIAWMAMAGTWISRTGRGSRSARGSRPCGRRSRAPPASRIGTATRSR